MKKAFQGLNGLTGKFGVSTILSAVTAVGLATAAAQAKAPKLPTEMNPSSKRSKTKPKESDAGEASDAASAAAQAFRNAAAGQVDPQVLGRQDTDAEFQNSKVLGADRVDDLPLDLPWLDDAVNDPDHITLSMKYVVYRDDKGRPLVSKSEVKELLKGINTVFRKCNLHFQMGEYVEADAKEYGLSTYPSSMSELDPIRRAFDDPKHIVLITTGEWNNSGGLGADGANAWTMMPGNDPSGAIVEEPVSKSAELIAHELGHYLNLDHQNDPSNLMNPTIYDDSTLSDSQCAEARNAAKAARSDAIRS